VLRVRDLLSEPELELWSRLPAHDRRHSLDVLRRFDRTLPEAERSERAAAVLHDVGKIASGLGRTARIVATVVGPRGRRFARYHDHERLGAEMLRALGSHPRTVELVGGGATDATAAALRAADEV